MLRRMIDGLRVKDNMEVDLTSNAVLCIFGNTKMAKLWEEEIKGQISDGAWEMYSGKGNNELWGSSLTLIGNVSRPIFLTRTGHKAYIPGNMYEELDVVRDRMMEIVGTSDPEVIRKMCFHIQNAIRFMRYPKEGELDPSKYSVFRG